MVSADRATLLPLDLELNLPVDPPGSTHVEIPEKLPSIKGAYDRGMLSSMTGKS